MFFKGFSINEYKSTILVEFCIGGKQFKSGVAHLGSLVSQSWNQGVSSLGSYWEILENSLSKLIQVAGGIWFSWGCRTQILIAFMVVVLRF